MKKYSKAEIEIININEDIILASPGPVETTPEPIIQPTLNNYTS